MNINFMYDENDRIKFLFLKKLCEQNGIPILHIDPMWTGPKSGKKSPDDEVSTMRKDFLDSIETLKTEYLNNMRSFLEIQDVKIYDGEFSGPQCIFLDPDSGFGVKDSTVKHVKTERIKKTYEQITEILIIYQHKTRDNWETALKNKTEMMKETKIMKEREFQLPENTYFFAYNKIGFLVLSKNKLKIAWESFDKIAKKFKLFRYGRGKWEQCLK